MSAPTIPSPRLFDALRQASRSNLSKLQSDERKQILTFMPSQLDDLGNVLFSNMQKGGICTLVVSGQGKWNPRSYYFEAARQAASRGRDITELCPPDDTSVERVHECGRKASIGSAREEEPHLGRRACPPTACFSGEEC